MNSEKKISLKDRIIKEMTVDYSNALEKNFDLAKKFIRITNEGKIDILFKEKMSGKDQILLYLIGKLYAKEAGFTSTDDVGNKELLNELGVPHGSLQPWLKDLRDNNQIKQIKRGQYAHHSIPAHLIEKSLRNIDKKINKKTLDG